MKGGEPQPRCAGVTLAAPSPLGAQARCCTPSPRVRPQSIPAEPIPVGGMQRGLRQGSAGPLHPRPGPDAAIGVTGGPRGEAPRSRLSGLAIPKDVSVKRMGLPCIGSCGGGGLSWLVFRAGCRGKWWNHHLRGVQKTRGCGTW